MKMPLKKYLANYIRDFTAVDLESQDPDIEFISAGSYVYDLFDPMHTEQHEFNYAYAEHIPVILDDDMNCEWFVTVFFNDQMASLEIDLFDAAMAYGPVEGFELLTQW